MPFSVKMGCERLNVSNKTVIKAFKELEEKGFIICRCKGAFSVKFRKASEWEMTHLKPVSGGKAKKTFMQWKFK